MGTMTIAARNKIYRNLVNEIRVLKGKRPITRHGINKSVKKYGGYDNFAEYLFNQII